MAELGKRYDVTTVVPAEEQSWRSKAITRFGALRVEDIKIGGAPAHAVTGTPADCVNLGLYHLCSERPSWVVSGINAGLNVGVGFVLSSGTVGACFEANIARIPGLALSQRFDSDTWNQYSAEYALPERVVERLRVQTITVLDQLRCKLIDNPDVLNRSVTWNVNLPFELREDWELKFTSVGQTFYGSCFGSRGESFRHELGMVPADDDPTSDGQVVLDGHVSISLLDVSSFGVVPPSERQRLEEFFRRTS